MRPIEVKYAEGHTLKELEETVNRLMEDGWLIIDGEVKIQHKWSGTLPYMIVENRVDTYADVYVQGLYRERPTKQTPQP